MKNFAKNKFIFFITLLVLMYAFKPSARAVDFAKKPVIFTSILPQKYLAKRITGDFCEVEALIGGGMSPHSYEPLPRQMSFLSKAKIFFAIGLPFEKILIKRLKLSCPELKILNTASEIDKIVIDGHGKKNAGENELDPHVWLSPRCACLIAESMADSLTKLLPQHKKDFADNLKALTDELKALDEELESMLRPFKGQPIFVFHPAFGYFAKRYGLTQKAVEFEGKSPGIRRLAELIRYCRANNIRVIFVQKQFSAETAKTIASSINAEVAELDPLAEDYINNLRALGKAIYSGLKRQTGLK